MNRIFKTFEVSDPYTFKQQMLIWANQFNICCLLDNHNYQQRYHSYECLMAVGITKAFEPSSHFFSSLDEFYSTTNDWIFGHFNYDVKNRIENLTSANIDLVGFPEAYLFVPEVVIQLEGEQVSIGTTDIQHSRYYQQILETTLSPAVKVNVQLQPRVDKENYVNNIKQLQQHILHGDCYEINYCQEFYSPEAKIDPASIYHQLLQVSPNPFSSFYKLNDKYLLCASPERFLRKEGTSIISQPIKGTIKRNTEDAALDKKSIDELLYSHKERSENVMIVDLVRNDLSKICDEGTVEVKELFGIYSFPQLHQMISTVQGNLKAEATFSDMLKATFPMGSMTGAPKKRVMELIEEYEATQRGIYSGTVGYITPEKNFDFNVVIRSIVYNASRGYVSYHVGSAITYNSDAEKEYEECLLKAKAIKKVLQ
jgi:para-aminobenzoate synthetase component 1